MTQLRELSKKWGLGFDSMLSDPIWPPRVNVAHVPMP